MKDDFDGILSRFNELGSWRRRLGVFGVSCILTTSLIPLPAFAEADQSDEDPAEQTEPLMQVDVISENGEGNAVEKTEEFTESGKDGFVEQEEGSATVEENTDSNVVPSKGGASSKALTTEASASERAKVKRAADEVVTSGSIGETGSWTLSEGNVFTFSYEGSWDDYTMSTDNQWMGLIDPSTPLTVIFTEGVTSIPDYFGMGISMISPIEKLVLPDSLETIGRGAFQDGNWTHYPTYIDAPDSLSDGTFLYYDKEKTQLCCAVKPIDSVVIPEGVKSIGPSAFANRSYSSVYISSSVENIDVNAFFFGTVKSVEVSPDNPHGFYIQNDVTLSNFGSLMNSDGSVVVPVEMDTATDASGVVYSEDYSILYSAPDDVSGSYEVAEGCVTILDEAFANCTALTGIAIPESVQAIGKGAFSGCTSLASANIPSSLTAVPDDLFNGCSSLASITIPSGITAIGQRAFQGCSSLTEVSIPDSVTTIGYNAFENCTSLEALRLSASLTSLQNYAFQNCTSLKYITMPDGMTNIGPFAFNGCTSLETVVIPDSVTYIDVAAFANTNIKTFIAPSGLWSKVESHDKFSGDSDSVWNTAAIFTSTSATGFSGEASDEKVFSSVESIDLSRYTRDYIPTYMFMGLNKLTEVQIPANIRIIDSGAFFMCTGLRDVYMYNQSPSIAGAGTTGDPTLGWTSSTRPAFSYWTWNAIEGWVVVSMSDLNLYGLAYGNNDMIAYAAENDCNFIPFVVLDNYDTKALFGFDVTGYNNIEIADMVYTGEALTPQVIATFTDADLGSLERNLTNDSGCTIVYKDANGNTVSEIVGAGTYTAQITGDNKSVFGTKTIQFEVVDPAAAQEGQQQGGQQGGQQQGTQQQGVQQQGGVVYPAGYTQQQATGTMAQTGDGTDVAPLAVASLAALGVAAASAAVVSRKRSAKSADEHSAR